MHAVTCTTPGCENAGYTILLKHPGHTIICGPCAQPITNIDPPLPDEPYEQPSPTPEPDPSPAA